MHVEGLVDGFAMGAAESGNAGLSNAIFACISSMPGSQLVAIVDRYIANDATLWDVSLSALVFAALGNACGTRGHPFRTVRQNEAAPK